MTSGRKAAARRAPAGRKPAISREDIIAAALKLVGPARGELLRARGKGSKERIVPIGRPAVDALLRTDLELKSSTGEPRVLLERLSPLAGLKRMFAGGPMIVLLMGTGLLLTILTGFIQFRGANVLVAIFAERGVDQGRRIAASRLEAVERGDRANERELLRVASRSELGGMPVRLPAQQARRSSPAAFPQRSWRPPFHRTASSALGLLCTGVRPRAAPGPTSAWPVQASAGSDALNRSLV